MMNGFEDRSRGAHMHLPTEHSGEVAADRARASIPFALVMRRNHLSKSRSAMLSRPILEPEPIANMRKWCSGTFATARDLHVRIRIFMMRRKCFRSRVVNLETLPAVRQRHLLHIVAHVTALDR